MYLLAVLRRYMASADQRVAIANLIAMMLAWNTPFYPLYLIGSAGPAIQPGAWFALGIFPVFLAVPAITRRWPLSGRIVLATAALSNTVWCSWLFGEASGTQLFLLPCIFLAAITFRYGEPIPLVGFLTLPIILGLALHERYPASPFVCQANTCNNILWLNAISVALLCGFLGLVTSRMFAIFERVASVPDRTPGSTHRQPPPAR